MTSAPATTKSGSEGKKKRPKWPMIWLTENRAARVTRRRDEQHEQKSDACPSRKEHHGHQKGRDGRKRNLKEPEWVPGELADEAPVVPGLLGVEGERQRRAEKAPLQSQV